MLNMIPIDYLKNYINKSGYINLCKKNEHYRTIRNIIIYYIEKLDLNEEIIAIMCIDSYIRPFDNETDQFEFFKDKYEKAKAKYHRQKK